MVNNLLSAIIKDVVEKRKIIYLLAREEKSVNENKLCAALSREGDCPWMLTLGDLWVPKDIPTSALLCTAAGGWRGICNPKLPLLLFPPRQENTVPVSLWHQRPNTSEHNLSKLFSTQEWWILTGHFWADRTWCTPVSVSRHINPPQPTAWENWEASKWSKFCLTKLAQSSSLPCLLKLLIGCSQHALGLTAKPARRWRTISPGYDFTWDYLQGTDHNVFWRVVVEWSIYPGSQSLYQCSAQTSLTQTLHLTSSLFMVFLPPAQTTPWRPPVRNRARGKSYEERFFGTEYLNSMEYEAIHIYRAWGTLCNAAN